MIRRSLSATALVGALVVLPHAVAKPPDLPMNETITVTPKAPPSPERAPFGMVDRNFDIIGVTVPIREPKPPDSVLRSLILHFFVAPTPAESLYEALPDAVPTPTLYQLRPTARRTLVSSMLLGINPMLRWLPIEKALDAPHDHPQRVAGDDLFRDMPAAANDDNTAPYPCPCISNEIKWSFADGRPLWFEWLISHWTARQQPPSPEQNEGYLQTIATGMDFAYRTANDPPASENETPAPLIEVLPMPREDDITCPYLRQQKTDRHACQFADPQIGRDVLENLERLKQADDLIETAKALAADGCLGEAMECCLLAQELCPGSPSADRAAAVLFGLCFGADQPEMDAEEAAEEEPDTSADSRSQGESLWEWLAQWMGFPINVYDPDPNERILELLNQSADMDAIEAEWERIWFTEMPSRLTPERVHGGLSPDSTEAGIEEQVRGLMKACRLLMCEGRHEQAAELARQAFALDPERVMADPLLYKMHLLADTPRSHESSEASEPPSCPYCPSIGKPIQGIVPQKKESDSGPTTLLVPPMPPVDYEVVPALDRVLTESAGAEEASEEAGPSSLPALIEEIMDSVGVDAHGGPRLSGEWSCGGSVYHLRYNRGCLAIWKTPDAAKVKP
jgi:hypothetical protein